MDGVVVLLKPPGMTSSNAVFDARKLFCEKRAGHLGTLGRSLTSSVTAYNKAVASFETRLLVTAREFEALDVPLEQVPEIDANAREFTRAELTG